MTTSCSSSSEIRTVSVIGLGHIGLPTAALIAMQEIEVIGVDIDQNCVDVVNQGKSRIVEPQLDDLVSLSVRNGYLRATTLPEPAEAFFIAVPTPLTLGNKPNLEMVRSAAASIAPVLTKGNIVILESTSPVGTTRRLSKWLADARPDLRFPISEHDPIDVHVAYCPERVLPGQAVRELQHNDRVIGGITCACSQRAAQIYNLFVKGKMHFTSAPLAEMIKLAENAFRDVNIAFANELSMICDEIGVDIWRLVEISNHHPRVNILQPGSGVGGHCIAVDPWFILDNAHTEACLIRAARQVNDSKPAWITRKIERAVSDLIATGREEASIVVAVLGLAFKPNVADLRGSPALAIFKALHSRTQANLLPVEPSLSSADASTLPFELHDLNSALSRADIVALLVAHNAFHDIDARLRRDQIIVDAVGITSDTTNFPI